MTRIIDMRADLQAESSGSLFMSPIAGGAAYCDSPSTGRTAC